VQSGAPTVDDDGAPTIKGQRRLASIVELALDDDAPLVRDQSCGGLRWSGLPLEGEGLGMR
jgi:hypothetical protein